MTVQAVLDWLDSFAPFETAIGFDNVGLLVGDASAQVSGALFCLDATAEAAQAAARNGCNLIVSHHPVLFHGVKRIDYSSPEGRLLCELARQNMHLIAAHTNMDQAPGGMAESLARAIGLSDLVPNFDRYARVGLLDKPLSLQALADRVEQALHIAPRVYGRTDEPIRRVGVGPGAFGEGYESVIPLGAQAYLTGEIHHHQALDAIQRGLVVLEAGHYHTEQPGVRALYRRFQAELAQSDGIRAILHDISPDSGMTTA